MKQACAGLDGEGIPLTGRLFNPKMQCTALKLPSRWSQDEIACAWEFVIDD